MHSRGTALCRLLGVRIAPCVLDLWAVWDDSSFSHAITTITLGVCWKNTTLDWLRFPVAQVGLSCSGRVGLCCRVSLSCSGRIGCCSKLMMSLRGE